jgi:glycosyltransferase involved in cell wall biosynthesis
VAYPLLPVGPDSGGGAEQILFLLEQGLVRSGERSIVIAAEGSRVAGELIETPAASGEITDAVREEAQRAHLRSIECALGRYPIDLIHFHGLDFSAYLPAAGVPKLATLHLPLDWYPQSIFVVPHVQLTCVSETQANSAPDDRKLPVVSNGIDVEAYSGPEGTRDFLLWIGRICPEKAPHVALRIAHRLDLPMIVAGPVHPFRYHQTYFAEQVEPLLDDQRRYAGSVGLEKKVDLLRNAKCVLIPSLAAETSSLVAMEAMSSGTPVIAFRSGALPEIIEHGRTGFVVDSEEQMLYALSRVDEISHETCRSTARARFDARRMVSDYRKLYSTLV